MRGFLGVTLFVTHNFLDRENWPISPSVEDLAAPVTLRLVLRVDGNVEELAVAIAFALQGSTAAIAILQAVSFVKRRPRL